MNLYKLLEDQYYFQFVGKLNILDKNKQLVGSVCYCQGIVVAINFLSFNGLDALTALIINYHFSNLEIKFVLEPEIVQTTKSLNLSFKQIYSFAQRLVKQHRIAQRFFPKKNLIISFNNLLKEESNNLNSIQTEIIDVLKQSPMKVDDLKKKFHFGSQLFNYELVNLKAKHLVLVKKN